MSLKNEPQNTYKGKVSHKNEPQNTYKGKVSHKTLIKAEKEKVSVVSLLKCQFHL